MEIIFAHKDVVKFFLSIESGTRQKMARSLDVLREFGPLVGMPISKPLGGNLFELRILGSVHIRFIYCYRLGSIVILHGFVKKTDKISLHDLQTAIRRKKSLYS